MLIWIANLCAALLVTHRQGTLPTIAPRAPCIANDVPTIVPTIPEAPRTSGQRSAAVVPAPPTISGGPSSMAPHGQRIAPERAALAFVRWAAGQGLARDWAVDDVWFLASEDFAPAHGYTLPPRRVFLGALQKVAGVIVAYDRRHYARNGRLIGKTTFYRLPEVLGVAEAAGCAQPEEPLQQAA